MKRTTKWLKRIGIGLTALILVAIVAGAVSEQVARSRVARQFPAMGTLVDIGGRRIQLDCRGTGSPIVVFEPNDLWGSLSWARVQDQIAASTRTCSYSRAGVMWSDPADGLRDAKAIAEDLHIVLKKAGEHPPFVLVGHSLGGLFAVVYTKYFGAEVAGLVLVDPAHPDMTRAYKAATGRDLAVVSSEEKIAASLSWTGLTRTLLPSPQEFSQEFRATPAEAQAMAAYAPMSLAAMVKEIETFDKTLAEVRASHDLGARPLYILTSMAPASEAARRETQMSPEEDQRYRTAWKGLHDDEASWSTVSQHLLIPDSGHRIHSEKPELVIRAVDSVVEAVRSGNPLQP